MLHELERRVNRLENQRNIAIKDNVVFADNDQQAAEYQNKRCIVIIDDLQPDKDALITN